VHRNGIRSRRNEPKISWPRKHRRRGIKNFSRTCRNLSIILSIITSSCITLIKWIFFSLFLWFLLLISLFILASYSFSSIALMIFPIFFLSFLFSHHLRVGNVLFDFISLQHSSEALYLDCQLSVLVAHQLLLFL